MSRTHLVELSRNVAGSLRRDEGRRFRLADGDGPHSRKLAELESAGKGLLKT